MERFKREDGTMRVIKARFGWLDDKRVTREYIESVVYELSRWTAKAKYCLENYDKIYRDKE